MIARRSRAAAGAGIAILLASLAWPVMAPAHHSVSVIDTSAPVWVKGRVLRYRPGAPHAVLELEEQAPDGQRQRWLAEGPFPGRMARLIAQYGGSEMQYLKPGDVIEVCGFRPKATYAVERTYADLDPDRSRFLHAELMIMPDGRLRTWGPYGKLDNCVRPGDTLAQWLAFLARDPLARELWCAGQRLEGTASVTPRSFVEDVNRMLAAPCP